MEEYKKCNQSLREIAEDVKKNGTETLVSSQEMLMNATFDIKVVIEENLDNIIARKATKCTISVDNVNTNRYKIVFDSNSVGLTEEEFHYLYSEVNSKRSTQLGIGRKHHGAMIAMVRSRKFTSEDQNAQFISVHNGVKRTKYACVDAKNMITCCGPQLVEFVDEPDSNKVTYFNCGFVNTKSKGANKEFKQLHAYTCMLITPYLVENPGCDFKFVINGKEYPIVPINLDYTGVEVDGLVREVSTVPLKYNGVSGNCIITKVWADKSTFGKDAYNGYDKAFNFSPESSGVYFNTCGTYLMCGGLSSWESVGIKWASTLDHFKFFLSFDNEDLEKAIVESLIKTSAVKREQSISLCEIEDRFNGHNLVFNEVIDCVKSFIKDHKKGQGDKQDVTDVVTSVKALPEVIAFAKAVEMWPSEVRKVILSKKVSSILK